MRHLERTILAYYCNLQTFCKVSPEQQEQEQQDQQLTNF